MTEPAITPAIIAKHGLTPDEYTRIQTILGREPNFTELGIFSVMWSEHCSYKNSKTSQNLSQNASRYDLDEGEIGEVTSGSSERKPLDWQTLQAKGEVRVG